MTMKLHDVKAKLAWFFGPEFIPSGGFAGTDLQHRRYCSTEWLLEATNRGSISERTFDLAWDWFERTEWKTGTSPTRLGAA